MKSWAALFGAGVGLWAKKVLVTLGIGIISYAGFSALAGQIKSAVEGAWGGLPTAVYQILALAGIVNAMGVWFGAFTAAVALMSFKKLGLLTA